MKLYAYGKINLGLSVFAKSNNEKKHCLDSIFYLYPKQKDVIYIKKAKSLSIKYLKCSIPQSKCLILKTLKYLHTKFNWDINYKIKVKKNILPGTGFGGGSSDAAAIINYLLWQHPHTSLDLEEIALVLGSDIPFFLSGYIFARVKQYGNFVSPIVNLRAKYKVLTNKKYCVNTQQVFSALDRNKRYHSLVNIDHIFHCLLHRQFLNTTTINDLTPYILQVNPKLTSIYQTAIHKHSKNYYVFFTGSGSSIVLLKKYTHNDGQD